LVSSHSYLPSLAVDKRLDMSYTVGVPFEINN